MPQENVELVRKATDAWISGGVEALLPFYAEDEVCYPFPDSPESSSGFHGHDGIRELAGNWDDRFDDYTIVAHEIRDLGDTVVALGEISGMRSGASHGTQEPRVTAPFVMSALRRSFRYPASHRIGRCSEKIQTPSCSSPPTWARRRRRRRAERCSCASPGTQTASTRSSGSTETASG